MENTTPTDAVVSAIHCEHCNAENAPDKKFCTQCRYPIGGTDEEKHKFRGDIHLSKIRLKDAEDKIRTARIIIYVLAGFCLIAGLIAYFGQDDAATLMVNGLICILYLGLSAWVSSNPFGALLTAFIIYLTLILVNAIIDPVTLLSGILWKVIFIGALVKGIRSATEARTLMRELEKAKVVPVGSYD